MGKPFLLPFLPPILFSGVAREKVGEEVVRMRLGALYLAGGGGGGGGGGGKGKQRDPQSTFPIPF